MLSIGLRYCGGCNPRIDRPKIVRDLKEGLEKQGLGVSFFTDRRKAFDVLLLINGCMHACSEQEYLRADQDVKMISVKGEMVDDSYIQEKDIPAYLIDKITRIMSPY